MFYDSILDLFTNSMTMTSMSLLKSVNFVHIGSQVWTMQDSDGNSSNISHYGLRLSPGSLSGTDGQWWSWIYEEAKRWWCKETNSLYIKLMNKHGCHLFHQRPVMADNAMVFNDGRWEWLSGGLQTFQIHLRGFKPSYTFIWGKGRV